MSCFVLLHFFFFEQIKKGRRSFGIPQEKWSGIEYGSLALVTKQEADLSSVTLFLKSIGTHPSFGNATCDMFLANSATRFGKVVLMLGSKPLPALDEKTELNLVNWNASDFPHPSHAICISGGGGQMPYAPTHRDCLSFALENGFKGMTPFPNNVDAKSLWSQLYKPDTVASSQNVVVFQSKSACRKLMSKRFQKVTTRDPLFEDMALVLQADISSLLIVSEKARRIAPSKVKDRVTNMLSRPTRAPVSPSYSNIGRYSSQEEKVAEVTAQDLSVSGRSSCVASVSVLISTNCCPAGFFGPNCDAPLVCMCSIHGTCALSVVTGLPACVCDPGFAGPDCSIAICPSSSLGYECSGAFAGKCDYVPEDETSIPRCNCSASFTGVSCSIPVCIPSCGEKEECRSNGTVPSCFPLDVSGCSDCKNGATCVDGLCICASGFQGENCQFPSCPKQCSGNGLLKNTVCNCCSF